MRYHSCPAMMVEQLDCVIISDELRDASIDWAKLHAILARRYASNVEKCFGGFYYCATMQGSKAPGETEWKHWLLTDKHNKGDTEAAQTFTQQPLRNRVNHIHLSKQTSRNQASRDIEAMKMSWLHCPDEIFQKLEARIHTHTHARVHT